MDPSDLIVTAFKSVGGNRWEGIFTNIFYDRDVSPKAPKGERFVLDGIKEFVTWANEEPANMPALWFWHLPNVVLGQTDHMEVIGPFAYATGVWGESDVAQKAKAFFSSPAANEFDWGMSHGYRYWLKDYSAGDIQRFRSKELSVLPTVWAANLGTQFTEGSIMPTLREDLVKALQSVLGMPEDDAQKTVSEGETEQKKGLKAGEAEGQKETAAETTTETTAAAPEEDGEGDEEDVEVTDDALALALADVLVQSEQHGEAIKMIAEAVKQISADVKKLQEEVSTDVKGLKAEAEARKTLLPRAVAKALEDRVKSATAPVDSDAVNADVDKTAAALSGAKDYKADPLGWFAEQAGVNLGGPKN